jgi:ATP:cob(I)alamin adenosyltransferase
MKIYTKTGDKGETGLYGGSRISKASARVESYGNIDELNANIGVAKSHIEDEVSLISLRKFNLICLRLVQKLRPRLINCFWLMEKHGFHL